jgi:hypothetical protein
MQGSAQYPPFDAATTPIGNGCTLLEASAGTGKTFAITRVVLRLLLEGRVRSIDRVLVVTFTQGRDRGAGLAHPERAAGRGARPGRR